MSPKPTNVSTFTPFYTVKRWGYGSAEEKTEVSP